MSWVGMCIKISKKEFMLFFRNVTVIKRNHTTAVDVDGAESKAIGTNEMCVCVCMSGAKKELMLYNF